MNNKLLFTLMTFGFLFYFSVMADNSSECAFQATVHPSEKTEMVKEIYMEACQLFTDTFNAGLNPSIELNNVHVVRSWEGFGPIGIGPNSDFYVFFDSRADRPLVNDLYVNETNLERTFDLEDGVAEKSVFFQGFFHFFLKSASLVYRLEQGISGNLAMDYSLAFWGQNKYIERLTKGKKDMWDYFKTVAREGLVSNNFVENANSLYHLGWEHFVHNAIGFINKNPEQEYNNIVNNNYPFLQ